MAAARRKWIIGLIMTLVVGLSIGMVSLIQQKYSHKQQIVDARVNLPAFVFEQLDGNRFAKDDLAEERPTVIVYFNPDCSHCEVQAQYIKEFIQDCDRLNWVLVSTASVKAIDQFASQHGLKDCRYLHMLLDSDGKFFDFFGQDDVPSTLVYNSQNELVKAFKGEVSPEILAQYF